MTISSQMPTSFSLCPGSVPFNQTPQNTHTHTSICLFLTPPLLLFSLSYLKGTLNYSIKSITLLGSPRTTDKGFQSWIHLLRRLIQGGKTIGWEYPWWLMGGICTDCSVHHGLHKDKLQQGNLLFFPLSLPATSFLKFGIARKASWGVGYRHWQKGPIKKAAQFHLPD